MDQVKGRIVATRSLLYSVAGGSARQAFTISIGEPYLLTEGSVDFAFAPGTAGCASALSASRKGPRLCTGRTVFKRLNWHWEQ